MRGSLEGSRGGRFNVRRLALHHYQGLNSARDQEFASTLLELVSSYLDLSAGIVKALLASDAEGIGDTDVLAQFDGWFAAATQLFGHVWRVTGASVDVAT